MSENGIVPSPCDRTRSSVESGRTRLGTILLSRPVGALAGSIMILIFLGCMSLSFGGLSIGCKTEPEGMTCQEGKVRMVCGQELDVYYPVLYASPPNLEIDGDPHDYKIIEQKADHFRIHCIASNTGGQHWNWKARGPKCPPPGTTPTMIVTPPASPPDPPPPTKGPSSPLPPPTPIQNP